MKENTAVSANWHALEEAIVLAKLETSISGLTAAEVAKRQKIFGLNQLKLYKSESPIFRFLRQFHNILIYILLASSLVTIYLQQWVDSSVIFGVVIINAIVGFIQEGKAAEALSAIRDMLAPMANVLRDNKYQTIYALELVPGDIVVVKSGDKIPADLRLLSCKNLELQEATLTGESLPVEKDPSPNKIDAPLADRHSMAYSGTLVAAGNATGVVSATGLNTEIGKISTLLSKIPTITTPLLQQINIFGWWLSLAIILLAAFTFFFGALVWGHAGTALFMAVVGLTVAAIPEGLPAVMTIILAIGVKRMAKRNAIVRKLPVVETMGSVSVICTDKTGTLTRNELAVQNIVTSKQKYLINDEIPDAADLIKTIEAAILCNDAAGFAMQGNPIDMALLHLGETAKLDINLLRKNFPRTDLIPHESAHKFMATLHHDHTGKACIYIKGAAEIILKRCSLEQNNGQIQELNMPYWHAAILQLAKNGQRVIAIAYKKIPAAKQNLQFQDVEGDLVLLALFGLIDPPRPEAKAAVLACINAGISVKMITGDHLATAEAIARQVGIEPVNSLTGTLIDALDDASFAKAVTTTNIFARTSPAHKMRLVKALQANGEVVAMTGDGVNDAPALHQADIGIAMGKKGAEIAKEASAMVLADDNFATIANAVAEGRTIFDNLKKAILFIIPTNSAEALLIVLAVLFNTALPITAVQIMWVNMLTGVTLALALGFEPAEEDIMLRAPRSRSEPLLSLFLVWRVIFVSLLMVAAVFALFLLARSRGLGLELSRTIAVNVIVMAEVVYVINCRRIYNSTVNRSGFFSSRPILLSIFLVVVLQLAFTYVPLLQQFFGTAALSLLHWIWVVGVALILFFLVETEKYLLRLVEVYRKLGQASVFCSRTKLSTIHYKKLTKK